MGASGDGLQQVAFDYSKRVAHGQTDAEAVLANGLNALTQSPPLAWSFCRRLNETVCDATQGMSGTAGVTVALWNQLCQSRQEVISLPVSSSNIVVTDAATGKVPRACEFFLFGWLVVFSPCGVRRFG